MLTPAVPCYVSGKGMFATQTTTQFKTCVIDVLESTGLGYDTRYAYYQKQYPELSQERLSRLICDPMEYYDKDWPAYLKRNNAVKDSQSLAVDFFLPLDNDFRAEAQVGIVCFDEAGFGTGVNCMRFLYNNKPILGFINPSYDSGTLNKDNVYQLKKEFPKRITLHHYDSLEEIQTHTKNWLAQHNNPCI